MRRLRIGSMLGIPIQLGLAFLLALPLFAYLVGSRAAQTAGFLNAVWDAGVAPEAVSSGATPWLLAAAAAFGLFAGVVIHELGHSLVALHFGYAIESITLGAFGGVATLAGVPEDWRRELLIAVAGPLASAFLAVGCYAGFLALPETASAGRFVLGFLAVLNAGLVAFNLLPGFPMDGGRVLRAVLARTRPYPHATRIAASVGEGIALLLGFLGVLSLDAFVVGAAFLVYVGASSETRPQIVDHAFGAVAVRDIMTPAAELDDVAPGTNIADLIEQILRQRHVGYPVVEGGTVVGIVTLDDLGAVAPIERAAVTVADVMSTDLKTIPADADAMEALAEIQRSGVGRVLVTDEHDQLVGVLTRTDVTQAITVGRRTRAATSGTAASESEPSPYVRPRR